MLVAVALAFGAACVGMALVQGLVTLALSFAGLWALGQRSLSIIATLLVAQWFVRYRGRAMAVVWLGLFTAGAALPPASLFLIERAGWRWAYAALGLIVWLLVIPAALLVVRRRPEDIGLRPDGGAAPAADVDEDAKLVPAPRRAGSVLRTRQFWWLAILLAAPAFATAAACANGVSGYLADRFGAKRVLLLALSVFIAAMLVLQLITTPLAVLALVPVACMVLIVTFKPALMPATELVHATG